MAQDKSKQVSQITDMDVDSGAKPSTWSFSFCSRDSGMSMGR